MKIATWLLLVIVLVMPALADEEPGPDESDSGWIVLPNLGYSPERGFIIGGAAQYYSVPAPGAPTDTFGFNAIYGTEGNYSARIFTDYRFGSGGPLLEAGLGVSLASDEFAGTGRRPELEDDPDMFEVLEVDVSTSLLFAHSDTIRVGPTALVNITDIRDVEEGGLLDSGGFEGSDGAVLSGVGARARYDTRDSNVYATEGLYADVSGLGFMPELAASSRFASAKLDLRGFHSPVDNFVVGGQLTLESVAGNPPIQGLATFGGSNMMRGVPRGLYRDNHAVAGQLELRTPRLWRFSGVLFGGAATDASDPSGFVDEPPVAAGGIGLRFAVAPEQNQNLRFDVAWDGERISPYISFGEAF